MRLPVGVPLFSTFSHHAAVLSVLSGQEGWRPWFYRHYLPMMGFVNEYGGYLTMDAYVSIYTLSSCPWIHLESVPRETVKQQGDLIPFVIDWLDRGYYLYVGIDGYDIFAYSAYQTYRLPHPVLIYGYDAQREVCCVADFFSDKGFSFAEASWDELRRGFDRLQDGEPFGSTINMFSLKKDAGEPGNLHHLAQTVRGYEQSLAPADVHLHVRTPINSVNTILTGEHWINSHPKEVWFGMEIYDRFLSELKSYGKSENDLDLRNFATIYHHKKLLYSLHQDMQAQGPNEQGPELGLLLAGIEKNALLARNAMLKYVIGGKLSASLVQLSADYIEEMAELERRALPLLALQLESKVFS